MIRLRWMSVTSVDYSATPDGKYELFFFYYYYSPSIQSEKYDEEESSLRYAHGIKSSKWKMSQIRCSYECLISSEPVTFYANCIILVPVFLLT